MLFAHDFSDNNIAKIVSEIPWNSPCSYGNIYNQGYYTPNLRFSSTYKKFYRYDEIKDSNRIVPDIQVLDEEALDKICELIQS